MRRAPDPNSRAFLHLRPDEIADRAAQYLVDALDAIRCYGRPDARLDDADNAACAEAATAARALLLSEVVGIVEGMEREAREVPTAGAEPRKAA